MGWWTYADRFIRPIFELVRPVPPIAWIPLVVVWMGVGLKAKALIIFFTAFVPCVINSYTGIKLTNKTLIDVSRTFGASNREIFWKVGVPSSLPMVFAGIRVALGNSWSTLVAAEMLAASSRSWIYDSNWTYRCPSRYCNRRHGCDRSNRSSSLS